MNLSGIVWHNTTTPTLRWTQIYKQHYNYNHRRSVLLSVKAGFLHDTQELLLVHFSIPIPVCFLYHLLSKHNQQGIREVLVVSRVGLVVFRAVRTCSSSSVRFSPSSLATLFKFLNEILPVSSSSNSRKAFRISSLESFSA